MNRTTTLMILLLSTVTAVIAVPKYETRVDYKLFVARPIDMAQDNNGDKNCWLGALLDAQARFRFEPIPNFHVTDFESIAHSYPDIAANSTPQEQEMVDAAVKMGCTHVFLSKFELLKGRTIHYSAEITAIQNRHTVASIEQDLPCDKFSASLDTALLMLVHKCGVTQTQELERFFQIPILGTNYKNARQLGELIEQYRFSTDHKVSVGRDYERLIEKDAYMLLANYFCAHYYFANRDFDKSAKYVKELLDLTPYYTSLNLLLVRSYRLCGRYQDALATATDCDRMRLRTTPYLLERALTYEGLGMRGPAITVFNQVLALDPNEPTALLALAKQRNNEGKAKDALVYVNRLLSIDNGNGKAFYERARSYFQLGQLTQSPS